jgi:CRP/FNR family transcriptional regulator
VYFGFLKTSFSDEYGDEKVLNFQMRGDLLGLDTLANNEYLNDVTALSDVELVIIPNTLNSFQRNHGSFLATKLIEILCKELITSQYLEHIISKLTAEARVAKFLISLGKKYARLGYSENAYNLLMTRNDIGSYLGLTLTTVSRILSEFSRSGIITVKGKSVRINDPFALKRLRHISAIRN